VRTLPLLLVDLGNTSVGVALLAEHGADASDSGARDTELRVAGAPVEEAPASSALARVSFGVAGLAVPGGGFDVYVATVAQTYGASRGGSGRGARVFVASVQRPAVAAQVDDVLRRHDLGPALCNVPSGLALALRNPETCGFDRQYGARAALARASGPALVVSAGTALTVDAVVPWDDPRGHAALAEVGATLRDGDPPAGVFLGGAIAPGPRLLVEALARGGARLFAVDGLGAEVPALAQDSAAALRAGVVHGFLGAARALVERVGAEAGLGAAPIWLSGGAAPLVRDALIATFGARLREAPALVLEGLAQASKDAPTGSGEAPN